MTDETFDNSRNEQDDVAGDAGTVAKPPARRRSRRAATAAGSPASEATDASAETPATAAETAADEPKAPARRRSRATSAAEPTQAAAEAPAEPTPVEAAPEGTTAKKTTKRGSGGTRRRATKASAAAEAGEKTDTAETAPGASEDPAVGESPAADAEAPAPRTTRRRSTRKGAEAPAEESKAVADEAPRTSDAEPSTTATVGGKARLATTALLFQAPDPAAARPRRRRASAPAGPPRHADEEQPAGIEAPAEEAELEAEVTESESAGAAEVEEVEAAEDDQETEVTEHETTDLTEGAETGEQDEAGEESGGEAQTNSEGGGRRRRRRGGRGRRGRSGERGESGSAAGDGAEPDTSDAAGAADADGAAPGADGESAATGDEGTETSAEGTETTEGDGTGEGEVTSSSRRRRRRRRSRGESGSEENGETRSRARTDEVTALKGSTRLEAKRQRRREGRDAGRRRTVITEAEFLARRESVERTMVVREQSGRVQIAILEDGVLVEHYVSRSSQNTQAPMAGNVYLGRVQNVLPSMEAAFVDIGKGRNAVLYAGEVNWDAVGLEGQPRRIEQALKSGDSVLVQVTKEPVGHKGARLTSQVTLAGRYLVYVPGGGMTGISRKLPEPERARLKKILREIVPDDAGVIVRTAAEGASDEELRRDVQRLQDQWAAIQKKAASASPPTLLQGEPDLAIRVVRDVFNDDFDALVVQGGDAWDTVWDYVQAMAPDLVGKVSRWTEDRDVFAAHRVDEQLAKGMERKVWLPSGGSLVIDRTEAMTVIDVNTGKFTGSGGTLEETVTRNNLEAAEEIVRQLRLRDIGGIIVIDFIDMVLESNRDLVLRRLVECLGRDRTKHQVAEVTSLGLVQMTRKRVGQGLFEAFSESCPHCGGRGYLIHNEPVARGGGEAAPPAEPAEPKKSRRKRSASTGSGAAAAVPVVPVLPEAREAVKATLATIAAAAAHAHEQAGHEDAPDAGAAADASAASPEAQAEASTAGPSGAGEVPQEDLLDALSSAAAVETPAAGADDDAPAPADGQPGDPGDAVEV